VFALVMWAPVALPYPGNVTLANDCLGGRMVDRGAASLGRRRDAAVSRLPPRPVSWTSSRRCVVRAADFSSGSWDRAHGYAIEKHGLAHRFTIAFLALPGLGGKTTRLTFAYMLIVGLISVFRVGCGNDRHDASNRHGNRSSHATAGRAETVSPPS
jgi:hypothetical protein